MNDSRVDVHPARDERLPLLEVRHATKSFGGVKALKDVTVAMHAGVALGIVGENGAGKSTLMKVLAGAYPAGAFEGSILMEGREVHFRGVRDARNAGIVLIPQELHIAADLSLSENMFAGVLPAKAGVVDKDALAREAAHWLRFFGLTYDPDLPASRLSPSEQRLILIAGALSQKARVLILDEPTASLSDGEAQRLFTHLDRLRAEGICIVFISHRLDDIAQVCDQVLVMRNGEVVKTFSQRNPPRQEIVAAMIGREQAQVVRPERRSGATQPLLELEGLSVRDHRDLSRLRVDGVSLTVSAGEIVGLFGLVGSGRTELLRAVFGAWPGEVTGTVRIGGVALRPKSPRHAIRAGLALLTEDRKRTGLFVGHSLQANFDAASIHAVSRGGFVDDDRGARRAEQLVRRLDVRARSIAQPVETLSGGNQQKVLLGRWLAAQPRVLLLDEPTIGVDVGAREELYLQIERMAQEGCGVLLVTSDLDEVMRTCDRTHVMYKGRLTATFNEHPTRQELMSAATGGE